MGCLANEARRADFELARSRHRSRLTVVASPADIVRNRMRKSVLLKKEYPIMQRRRPPAARTVGFTLVELLVVIAIIGVLVALLLPAVQAAREAARRSSCLNNSKNLALACLNYESSKSELPYGRKYDVWDTYTWTQLIMPYIEQQATYNLYWTLPKSTYVAPAPPAAGPNGPSGNDERMRQARHTPIPMFYCPSDTGVPSNNELDSPEWGHIRGSYRGSVGSGDMYGTRFDLLEGPVPPNALLGAFGVREIAAPLLTPGARLAEISDGTANTVLISEGLAPTVPHWGGPLGGLIYGNMGGSLFSTYLTPNSSEADRPIGPCPQDQQDTTYAAPCLSFGGHPGSTGRGGRAHTAARSFHPGGVSVSMVDGSVQFVSDGIDQLTWRYLGTRDRGDLGSISGP